MAALFVLGGCTKKEELLLISEESVAPEQEKGTETSEALPSEKEPEAIMQAGQTEETMAPVRAEQAVICVHVCGAVQRPGVYELQAGSRVYEAVQAAGGFAEEADRNYVNQARELTDGVKLVIPTFEEAEKSRGKENADEGQDTGEDGNGGGDVTAAQIGIVEDTGFVETGSAVQDKEKNIKVNINTASEAQLCEIPGIGTTRAAAITAYRESHGKFQKPEDIMKVSGIKKGMYEKIKDSICVN